MTMQTGQQPPEVSSTPPPVDPEAGKYEALRQELGIEADVPDKKADTEPDQRIDPAGKEPDKKADTEPEPQHVPRAEHENVQKALKEARERARASEERFAKALEALGQRLPPAPEAKKEEAPQIPDKLADPIGHYDARIAQLEAQLQQARQGSQMTAEQLQAYQYQQQFHTTVVRAEQEINDPKSANYKPDYWDAVNHLEAQRIAELAEMYPDNSPVAEGMARQMGLPSAAHLRQAVLNQDKEAVATQALQMGLSPAEFYYKLAHTRGYTPKPAGQPAPASDKAKQQIEAVKRGKNASVSISGGDGGRKGYNEMSISDLAELAIEAKNDPQAEKEFEAAWEAMRKQGRL